MGDTVQELAAHFEKTLDDERVSRSERKALRAVIAEADLDEDGRRELLAALFDAARARARDPRDRRVLDWLEDAAGLVLSSAPERPRPGRAWFGPEDPMVETVERFIRDTRRRLDVAVFTITHDRLSEALLDLHRRGVRVRVLSDDDKSFDPGSDIRRLRRAGVAVRLDGSPHHFHHKFAVRDGRALWVGSFNWTVGADRDNRENFLITEDPALVRAYAGAFERTWAAFA